MKRSAYIITFVLAVIFSLSSYGAHCWAGERIYEMPGDITAIDLGFNTVVVEVPIAGKSFTVGGPLSPDASLKRGGRTIRLSDFRVGDRVIIKWNATEKGHIILALNAK